MVEHHVVSCEPCKRKKCKVSRHPRINTHTNAYGFAVRSDVVRLARKDMPGCLCADNGTDRAALSAVPCLHSANTYTITKGVMKFPQRITNI